MKSPADAGRWLCIQLGSREHYAVPRALETAGAEVTLFTDQWYPRSTAFGRYLGARSGRFHPGFKGRVVAESMRFLLWELAARARRRDYWSDILARNELFSRRLARFMGRVPSGAFDAVFVYSYSALPALRWASKSGAVGILGQLDPGKREDELLQRLVGGAWRKPPPGYWDSWLVETTAAEKIMVNSRWSLRCLVEAGVEASRIHVVPLAYEAQQRTLKLDIPDRFISERPLRLLFLGQVIARKGVEPLLDAMALLRQDSVPVTLDVVGGGDSALERRVGNTAGCRYHGRCNNAQKAMHFRQADAFVLPTFSEGFALTQLEAQAAGLPLLVSEFCGDVVIPGVNGQRLGTVDAEALANAIHRWATEPGLVRRLAAGSWVREEFSLESVGQGLSALARGREAWRRKAPE